MIETQEIYVGRSYGRRELEITPELVRKYSAGTSDWNPRYTAPSEFGGPVAPALILHSEVYRDVSWYLSVYGNLHARQEWELFHPIMVGECVSAVRTIVDRYTKRDREYVVNEVQVFGADGRLLNRGRTHQSFLIKRGDGGAPVVDKDREKRGDRRFDLGEGEVIEEIEGAAKEITLDMCMEFSGPQKNYHNDIEQARALGFPDIVVQGMMSLCFISEMMTDRYGAGWYVGGRMNVNLVNVLWQGETVRPRAVVREAIPEGSRERAQLQVWCEKADGTKIVVGTASALTGG
jgi:acyl dehydratase